MLRNQSLFTHSGTKEFARLIFHPVALVTNLRDITTIGNTAI